MVSTIVIALCACVLAVLPAIKSSADGSRCASRLKELSQAVLLYAQDNEHQLPGAEKPTYGQIQGIWFDYHKVIEPYLDLREGAKVSFFSCPFDKDLAPAFPSYLFNGGNEYMPEFKGVAGKRTVTISAPSRTLLLFEGSAIYAKEWHSLNNQSSHNNARSYASFVDGHVAYVPFYANGAPINAGVNPPPEYSYIWGE